MSSTSKKSDKRGFSRITGLAALKGRLGNIILNGDNSCIMLTGPPGSGKRKLANLIAQAWLCEFPSENGACEECTSCHHFEQQNHFDYSELKPEDGKRIIPTDDVRSALKDLIMFPRLGKYKALVIDADSLNEQGQNALLKALEEPLPHNRFVLTVSDPSRLLLTVRSRVVNLRVDRRSDEEIFQILEEELTSRTTGGDSAEEKSTSAIGEDRFGEQELTSRTTGGDSAEEKSTSAIGGDRFGEQELTSRATGDDFAEEKSASAIGGDRFDEQELAVEVRGDDLKESALPPAKDVLSRTEAALSGVGTVLSRKDLSFYARFSDGIPGRALELVQGSWFGELRSGAAEIYFNLDKSGELDLFTGGSDFFKENKDQVDTALNIINSLIRDELCLHWGTNDRIVNIDLQDRLQAAYQRKLAILTKRREYKEKDTGFIRWHDEGTEGFNAEEQELHLRLTHAAEVIEDSREALQRNVNFELTITRLLLQLKYVASGEELIESRKDERFS